MKIIYSDTINCKERIKYFIEYMWNHGLTAFGFIGILTTYNILFIIPIILGTLNLDLDVKFKKEKVIFDSKK